MRSSFRLVATVIAMLSVYAPAMSAYAETVLSTSELVATSEAAFMLPQAKAFTITTAGTYELQLSDAGFPGPLDSLRAVIVHDGQTVAQVDVGPGESGTDTFIAQTGDYRIHVFGEPPSQQSGSYSVRVRGANGGATLVDEAGSINAIAEPSATTVVALVPVQITTPGTYSLNIVDHQFPTALQSFDAVVLYGGDVVLGPTSTFPASFSAMHAGDYVLSVRGQVTAGEAGLFGIHVSGGQFNEVVKNVVQEVGRLPAPVTLNLPTAGTYTLATSDAQFPQSLTSFKTLVIQGSELRHLQDGATAGADFFANAGEIKLYSAVVLNSTIGVGSIAVRISDGVTPVYANVLIGDASPDPTSPSIYAATSTALAAGTYKLHLEDFGFPASLTSLRIAVAQADAVIDDWIGEGQYTFTAAAGPARILIAAAPSSATDTGLFGIRLEPESGGAAILESNQGVGGLFRTHVVTLTSAGSRDIELTDVGFPAQLATSALAVTSGTQLIGQVFGGGQLRTTLNPGTYVLNFLGKPDATEKYGLYALKMEDSPAPPTLTFSANPTAVKSGGTTTLQWSAADATSCTASGAWSGSQNVSGSFVTPALSAASTFQLSCNGPGGSVEKSVTVQISSGGKKSGGGGLLGTLDCVLLTLVLAYARRWRQHLCNGTRR